MSPQYITNATEKSTAVFMSLQDQNPSQVRHQIASEDLFEPSPTQKQTLNQHVEQYLANPIQVLAWQAAKSQLEAISYEPRTQAYFAGLRRSSRSHSMVPATARSS